MSRNEGGKAARAGAKLGLRRTRKHCHFDIIDKEIDVMRPLTTAEIQSVAGGTGTCTPANSGNNFYGITNSRGVGGDIVNVYEGAVFAMSHIIERVARAFKD